MEDSRSSMRHSNSYLGEMMIKVPAPFAGLSDLGFTVQYRAQSFNERQRDVPLLFEGPEPPMRRLAELLQLLSGSKSSTYAWTDPVTLSDEVVVLAPGDTLARYRARGTTIMPRTTVRTNVTAPHSPRSTPQFTSGEF